MKKKLLALVMAAAMVLSMAVTASAEGITKSIQLDGATFTLTADTIEDGAELTITASGMDEEWKAWSIIIHPVKDNKEYFSLVLEDGQTDFYTREEIMPVLAENQETFNMKPNTSRTFTLHIPEEFAGWTIDARIPNKTQSAYSTIIDPLILQESAEEQPPVVFEDVPEDAWFHQFVTIAASSGQMSGMGDGTFAPKGNLTIAQVLALATRVDLEAKGLEELEATTPWYKAHLDYCVENGIVSADRFTEADMNRPATRFEMVEVLDKVAGGSITQPINDVPDGFIPDVAESDPYGPAVYKWYRAGLTVGDAGTYAFRGNDNISRAEVAVIVCHLSNMLPHAEIK